MTVKVNYDGALVWYRTDSYFNGNSYQLGSTWGPSIKLSANIVTSADNNGLTNLGKTYVFAMGDGSGVALHHITYNTYAPTTSTTAGTGTNSIVTATASYTNKFPNLYQEDYCSATNFKLSGTTDTGSLTTAVKAWSDGYTVTSTVAMSRVITGAKGGWKGTCLAHYSDTNTLDNGTGSICHSVLHDSTSTAGPTDFGASYLIHVS